VQDKVEICPDPAAKQPDVMKVGRPHDRKQFQPTYGTAYDDTGEVGGFLLSLISFLANLALALTFPVSVWICFRVVKEYERAVVFRLGRLRTGGARGPGLLFVNPFLDTFRSVDLRTGAYDIPPQEILTRDSVTISVDAVVYYQVSNPLCAICNNDDFNRSTRLLAQTTLRNILGTKILSDILSDRETISDAMHHSLEVATDPWGVHVERVEIKDVRLPRQMQRVMAAEAEATREARAKVVAAEGEQKSSRALKDAADIIQQSPAALQLRYLQTLGTISAEKNSTIVFPLPMELVAAFTGQARE